MSQSVSTNSAETKLLQDSLKAIPGAAGRAGARALNYVVSGWRKEAGRLVAVDYAIPQSRIIELLEVLKATASMTITEAAVVGVGKKGQPLLDFVVGKKDAPSTKRTSGGGYTPTIGISVLIKRASGKKAVPGAFIAKMDSGHVGVFKRIPGTKWRIREEFVGSPINILAQPEYQEKFDSYVDNTMPAALPREIERELK